ncbi:MAG: hypothetical protein H8D94_00575 [Candidatus Pelagibacter sp.]|nr:hypothetical protein [Candidatus Pelagibacter sp.]
MKLTKTRLKQIIREEIQKLNEAKRAKFIIPMTDRKKTAQVLKRTRLKVGQDYDFGVGKGSTFILDIDAYYKNKFVELAIKHDIGVKS